MGTLPFFGVHYRGHQLKIQEDQEKCAKKRHGCLCAETKGDCLKFVERYLEIKWKNAFEGVHSWEEKKY
jgi:hypothetical protein